MKRLFHVGVLVLFLTGGWGTVLAGAPCPRAQGHACCAAKGAPHADAPERAHGHLTMNGMARMSHCETAVNSLSQSPESCAHCMSHSGTPGTSAVPAYVPAPASRDLSAPALASLKTLPETAPSFAPTVFSRQHAPPQTSTPRHLLISVFLI
jgi:hypothetical protein